MTKLALVDSNDYTANTAFQTVHAVVKHGNSMGNYADLSCFDRA
jgi:hypothetical protein